MKTYAIVLIACGSVAAAILVFCCHCKNGRKKQRSTVPNTVFSPTPRRSVNRDNERGDQEPSDGAKNGGMVILGASAAAAAAAVAEVAVVDSGGGRGGGTDHSDGGGGVCSGCGASGGYAACSGCGV